MQSTNSSTSSMKLARIVALTLAVVGVLGVVFIAAFYGIGPETQPNPFGTWSDRTVQAIGVLHGVLALLLFVAYRQHLRGVHAVLLALALVGAAVVAWASSLIISGKTGWFLAGLWGAAGWALVSPWMITFNSRMRSRGLLSRRLTAFGIVIGAVMLLGVSSLAGVHIDSDDLERHSVIVVTLFMVAVQASFWMVPFWSFLLSRQLAKRT